MYSRQHSGSVQYPVIRCDWHQPTAARYEFNKYTTYRVARGVCLRNPHNWVGAKTFYKLTSTIFLFSNFFLHFCKQTWEHWEIIFIFQEYPWKDLIYLQQLANKIWMKRSPSLHCNAGYIKFINPKNCDNSLNVSFGHFRIDQQSVYSLLCWILWIITSISTFSKLNTRPFHWINFNMIPYTF